ncbi:MAG: 2OG-Fe(II) oxygenase [Candidatus Competibacteraceae bacterium]
MSSITTELAELLSTVQRPGDFYTTGTIEFFAPHLEVEGVGPIALPLLPVQAEQLIAVAEQAPYGRGEETLVDTAVRRTWQIDASRIQIKGRSWAKTLEAIVAQVATGLGVTGKVVAELYKLLVYDQGSFFVSHRDTEKAPRMFATLVIVLPSIYSGGELLVRHRDREARLDLHCSEPSELAFAAFYADCKHEVLPITSGCRLTLVYNLLRQGKDRLPEPPSYEAEQARATALLRQWAAAKKRPDDDSPEKLIYTLEHAYTPAELGFEALKGADAAVADVLVDAASQADCDIHLALVTIEESGGAEYTGYYGSRRRRRWSDEEDEDEFEVGEVYDHSETLSEWRNPDGSQPNFGEFPFKEKELCPPDAFEDMEPDELSFQEATGNEGASFERTYRRAALVLWPRERRLAVFNQAGLSVTLPYLSELSRRWAESGEGPDSSLWRQAHELSSHMLRTWPKGVPWYPREDQTDTTKMLTLLRQLQDTALIDTFLANITAAGVYGKGNNEALIQAAALLRPARVAELIERIIAGNATVNLSACGDLLARGVAARITDRPADLERAATMLVEALPGDPARAPKPDFSRPKVIVESSFIVDLMTALGQIDMALAERAADYILAWPKTYGLDAVLVPAVRELTKRALSRDWAPVQRLRAACLEHLHARIAEPLEPPRDWTRASDIACRCSHCSELSRFLADPDRKSWTFKAAEADRSHVAGSIQKSDCDLDLTTERRGRPYSLVCTKNQASYDRRAQQRQQDLDNVAQLEAPPA